MQYLAYIFIALAEAFILSVISTSGFGICVISAPIIFFSMIIIEKLNDIIKLLEKRDK